MKLAGYAGPKDEKQKLWMERIWHRYFDVRSQPDILAPDYYEKSIAYSRYKHPELSCGFAEEWINKGDFYRRRTGFPVVLCHSLKEILDTTLDADALLNIVKTTEDTDDWSDSDFLVDETDSILGSELVYAELMAVKRENKAREKQEPTLDESGDLVVPSQQQGDSVSMTVKCDALLLDYVSELLFNCPTAESFASAAAVSALYDLPAPKTTEDMVAYSVAKRLAEIAAIAALREWVAYLEDWKAGDKPRDRLTWVFYCRLANIADLLKDGDGKERNKIARRSDNHIWLWVPEYATEFNTMLKFARDTEGRVRGLLLKVYERKTETVFERFKYKPTFMGGTARGTVLKLDREPYTAAYIPWVINSLAYYDDAIFLALELDKWTHKELELLEKAVMASGRDNLLVWTAEDLSAVPEAFKSENVTTPDGFNSNTQLVMYQAPIFESYASKVLSELDTKENTQFLNTVVKTAERLKKLYKEDSELVIGNMQGTASSKGADPTIGGALGAERRPESISYEELPENLIVKARRLIFKLKKEDSDKANHPYMCTLFNRNL